MNELDGATLLVSVFLTWGIGLTPPLVIRFAILRKPLSKSAAIWTCIVFWIFNFILFTALGSQSKTHGALFLIAIVSYWILRKGSSPAEKMRIAEEVDWADGDGMTQLMGASMLGRLSEMRDLIASGADVNATDRRGWTPIMYAVSRGELSAAELLLSKGADPSIRNAQGESATDIAEKQNDAELARLVASSAVPRQ